jgi:hypothetical protein
MHSNSQSSLDLNKFKIPINQNNSTHNNPHSNFTSTPPINKYLINESNTNSISTESYANKLPQFKPYNVDIFLGRSKQNNPLSSSTSNTVNNISVISSNYNYILHIKQLEEKKLKEEQNDPILCFKKPHQKESRRMMVEYVKLFNLKSQNNETITSILDEHSFSPFILQKKLKYEHLLQNMNNNNNTNKYNSYTNGIYKRTVKKKGTDITLGESLTSLQPGNEISSSSSLHHKINNNVSNSLKLVDIFLTHMDDDSFEKTSLLTFITIPRVLNMVITDSQKMKFVFECTPSNVACSYGIESYVFKWKDIKTFKQVGGFDLINVDICSVNTNNKNQFDIILSASDADSRSSFTYSIEADNEQDTKNYVNSINFIAQLIKCRAFVKRRK